MSEGLAQQNHIANISSLSSMSSETDDGMLPYSGFPIAEYTDRTEYTMVPKILLSQSHHLLSPIPLFMADTPAPFFSGNLCILKGHKKSRYFLIVTTTSTVTICPYDLLLFRNHNTIPQNCKTPLNKEQHDL